MAWKHHSEMTLDEMQQECEWLAECFDDYAEIGQGISTKESIRYGACFAACVKAGRLTEADRWRDPENDRW